MNDEIFGAKSNGWGENHKAEQLAQWLIDHPDFDDRPATMEEFLGPGYLDIDPTQNGNLPKGVGIRPGVKQALIDIFGAEIDPQSISEKREALFSGGIGIGKTTMASVALSYMVHWVCCLHDPQAYFGLLPGSRIAFMLMSTKDTQAKEVLFGDIKARINTSDWFKNLETPWNGSTAYDPNFKNQLRFPKDIWVLPGNSAETTFEGYNILGGVLDEGDSHKVTETKDYAEHGYRTIKARITSRFTNPLTGTHRGLLMVIGQMKAANGFMARKKEELEKDPNAKVVFMAIWESIGWDKFVDPETGKTEVFYYDIDRKTIIPPGPALVVNSEKVLRIPVSYKGDFELNPVQALKDHAGIPPAVSDPFIPTPDRVQIAQEKWLIRYSHLPEPVGGEPHSPEFHPEFRAPDTLKRTMHFDIGYAANGDAAGFAIAHIPELVEVRGELKPIIVFDALGRIRPRGGQQLMLEDLRQIAYTLRDRLGFKIALVTYDGFESQDSQQILRQKRFNTDELSVDRNKGPYEDLRQALFEKRIEFPRYMVEYNRGDAKPTNIAQKELLELTDTGRKIDHPPKGSKDVADCMAACVYALMVNQNFRRGAKRLGQGEYDVSDGDLITPGDALPLGLGGQIEPSVERELTQAIGFGGGQPLQGLSVGQSRPLPVGNDPFAMYRNRSPFR